MDVMRVEVVSNEYNIYSGEASFVVVPTVQGELGIYPRHEPIMSLVRPGALRLQVPGSSQEVLVAVSGGVLEVQPGSSTVLADTAIRGTDLDEARALEAKRKAEEHMNSSHGDVDYAQASAELAKAIAKLRVIELTKKAM